MTLIQPWQPNFMINVTILTFLSSTISFSKVTSRHLLHTVFTCHRTCNSYQDFLHRSVLLTRKLLNHGFIETRLRSTRKKFFGRYHHLTLPYHASVTTMANDICRPWYCCHKYVMTGAARGAGIAYPSGAPDFTSGFYRGWCCPVIVSPYFMW